MITTQQVEEAIFRAIVALNAERPPDDQVELSLGTPLFRDDARIDSLGLVSLIVDVESTLNTEHGLELCLADDRALARPQSPYATVETLRDFVLELARG
jgi:acyl carrier protein